MPNSWFIDFLEIKPREIPNILKKFNKDVVFNKKFLCTQDPSNYLSNIRNIYEYNSDRELKGDSDSCVIAMFKELFFGNYIDFLLILKLKKRNMCMNIKMEKKNIKIEMNHEELHLEFEYLSKTIEEYFKDLF